MPLARCMAKRLFLRRSSIYKQVWVMEEQRKNGIPISSLEEFIKAINENCIDKRRLFLESMDDVWFRGESKIHPKVIPSLFRDDFNENIPKGISVTKESDLIEMAFQSFPEVFSKCNNAIERLVTMQHYTLPTRLLDVTKNPLVASSIQKSSPKFYLARIYILSFFCHFFILSYKLLYSCADLYQPKSVIIALRTTTCQLCISR